MARLQIRVVLSVKGMVEVRIDGRMLMAADSLHGLLVIAEAVRDTVLQTMEANPGVP